MSSNQKKIALSSEIEMEDASVQPRIINDMDRDDMDGDEVSKQKGSGFDGENDDDDEDDDQTQQVRITLTTKIEKYKIPKLEMSISTSIGRAGLSELVNHMLEGKSPTPFEFVHVKSGKLIVVSLDKFMKREGVSSEDIMEIEYAPALQPPKSNNKSNQPDWISDIDFIPLGNTYLAITACYDGSLHANSFAKPGGKKSTKIVGDENAAHQTSIKTIRNLPVKTKSNDNGLLISGAKGGDIVAWEVSIGKEKDSSSNAGYEFSNAKFVPYAKCVGHQESVESIDAALSSDSAEALVCSGSWDRTIKLWQVSNDFSASSSSSSENDGSSLQDSRSTKKRKGADESGIKTSRDISSVAELNGHNDNVSAVVWGSDLDPVTLYSGSWDHTIKCWDVVRSVCTATFSGTKVVTDLAFSSQLNVIASSHADHCIRLWDTRITGDSVVKLQMSSVSLLLLLLSSSLCVHMC